MDSTTSFLLGIDQGEVIPFGDAGGYLLVVKTDSVLAFRVAYQTIPIQEADSLYTRNKNKIFDRKSWNQYCDPYHHWESELKNRQGKFYGSTGWMETEKKMSVYFEDEIKSHQRGDLFLFKNQTYNIAYLVYKTDQEKYFKRKYLVYLQPKK